MHQDSKKRNKKFLIFFSIQYKKISTLIANRMSAQPHIMCATRKNLSIIYIKNDLEIKYLKFNCVV